MANLSIEYRHPYENIFSVLFCSYHNQLGLEATKNLSSGCPKKQDSSQSPQLTCQATDACLTSEPGVSNTIPSQFHTFLEIYHEIISTEILLPSAESFKKGSCHLQAKSMCTKNWLTAWSSLARKTLWLGELTVPQ